MNLVKILTIFPFYGKIGENFVNLSKWEGYHGKAE